MATAINYIIYLTDLVQVHSLQATYPNGIQIPPAAAAAAYGVPGPAEGTNNLDATGGIGIFPQDSVGWRPDLTGAFNTQTFTLTYPATTPTTSGFPNPYPLTFDCYWVGLFLGVGAKGVQPAATPRYVGARRWANGFEVPTLGEGGSGQGQHNARSASRTPEGLGFAFRSNNNDVRTETLPASTRVSWERLYVQLLTLPVGGDDNIWGAKGSVDAGTAFLLNVSTAGVLQGYGKGNTAYPGTIIGNSAALTLNRWYRIDIRVEFLTPVSPSTVTGQMDVYIDGALSFRGTTSVISTAQNHQTSSVGEDVTATSHGLECNLDDWINAAEVTVNGPFGAQKYPGHDLTSGSHVKLVRPNGFGSNHDTVSWTGDWRSVNNNPANTSGATVGVQSVIPSAVMEVETDYVNEQCGVACITVGAFLFQVGGGAGALAVIAASDTQTAVGSSAQTFAGSVWSASPNAYSIASGATADALPPITSVKLRLTAGPAVGINQVVGLFGSAEILGIFGSEDYNQTVAPAATFTPRIGIHNGPFPDLQVNHTRQGPIGAVHVSAGTYIGNNLGQDVFGQIPAHWWFVRALSGSNDGVVYWTSMLAAHRQLPKKFQPEGMQQVLLNSGLSPIFRVAGNAAADNATDVVYQYVAVSDLAMRYMMNGAFSHKSTLAIASNPLVDSLFTPDAAFIFKEDYASAVTGSYYKGPGHSGYNASPFDAAEAADILSFGAGAVGSKATLNTDVPQTAFSLWRKSDGLVTTAWFDCVTYVGNGGGARNIAVALGGNSPLFVFAVPHDGTSYYKDPSHVGTNSSLIGGAPNTTTAITGGSANVVSVGATLNTNLVVYDLFVIGGGTMAFQNGTFTAVAEAQRTGGPWTANPTPVTVNPVVVTVAPQWRVHRFDMKPRREQGN